MRYAILYIHVSGGCATCVGSTPEAAKAKAKLIGDNFPRSYVAATVLYPCGDDVTPPIEIKEGLGPELMRLYNQDD